MSRERLIEALKEETLFKAKAIEDEALKVSAHMLDNVKSDCSSLKEGKLKALKEELSVKALAEEEGRRLTLASSYAICREELFQEMVRSAVDEIMKNTDGSYEKVLKNIYDEAVSSFKATHGDETFSVYLNKHDKELLGNAEDLSDDSLEKGVISLKSSDGVIEFAGSVKDLIEEVSSKNRATILKAVFGE